MTKHTPGPWLYQLDDPTRTKFATFGIYPVNPQPNIAERLASTNQFVDERAKCGVLRSKDQAEADARLIAAAPELLEALNQIVAKFESDPDDLETMDAGVKIARTAIAKATGQ